MNKYGLDLELEGLELAPFWQTKQFYLLIIFLLLLMIVGIVWRKYTLRQNSNFAVLDRYQQLLLSLEQLSDQLRSGLGSELFYGNLVFQIKQFIKYYYNVDALSMTDAELIQVLRKEFKNCEMVQLMQQMQNAANLARFAQGDIGMSQMNSDLQGVLAAIKRMLQLSK